MPGPVHQCACGRFHDGDGLGMPVCPYCGDPIFMQDRHWDTVTKAMWHSECVTIADKALLAGPS